MEWFRPRSVPVGEGGRSSKFTLSKQPRVSTAWCGLCLSGFRNSISSATKSGWRFYRAFYSFTATNGNWKVPKPQSSHNVSNLAVADPTADKFCFRPGITLQISCFFHFDTLATVTSVSVLVCVLGAVILWLLIQIAEGFVWSAFLL